jgi:hypothetical protein
MIVQLSQLMYVSRAATPLVLRDKSPLPVSTTCMTLYGGWVTRMMMHRALSWSLTKKRCDAAACHAASGAAWE